MFLSKLLNYEQTLTFNAYNLNFAVHSEGSTSLEI